MFHTLHDREADVGCGVSSSRSPEETLNLDMAQRERLLVGPQLVADTFKFSLTHEK
jgi:hypothetical protein